MPIPRFDPALLHGIASTTGASLDETADALVALERKGLARFHRRRGIVIGVQPLTPEEHRAETIAEGIDPDRAPVTASAFGNIRREPR